MTTGFVRVIKTKASAVPPTRKATIAPRVEHGRPVGYLALGLSIALAALYLPWSPAALVWPQEWLIVIAWCVLGYALHRLSGGRDAVRRSGGA